MNSVVLSQLVASTVMAGELSLMAAQVSGDLVSAHEKLGHILLNNGMDGMDGLDGMDRKVSSLMITKEVGCLFNTHAL